MLPDFLRLSWNEIKHRKFRSWLTLLGIVIGISAIVSLITLGLGLQNAIEEQFASLGNDKLFITAKGSALTPGITTDAVTITQKDVAVIRDAPGVRRAAAMIFSSGRIEFNDQVRYLSLGGFPTDPDERTLLGESQNYKIMKGRSLENRDTFKAVVGYEFSRNLLFGRAVDIGDKIKIQDKDFTIIGIWERIGSPPDDQSVTIPFDTYADLLNTDDKVGFIVAQAQPGENLEAVAERITKELRRHRNVEEDKEDFSVETPKQLLSTFSTILSIIQIVLVGIAAISLFVGGVGIMNTMYTAVLERTREIGIMKALGAQNKHILLLFLFESGIYGAGGGLIGAIVGILAAKMVEYSFALAVGPAFLSIKINPFLIIGTLLFSFIIGCISGIAPAYRASKFSPVESLRYE